MATLLRDLNKRWTPHAGQREIGQAIFSGGKRRIGVECGRKFGKTELAIDLCWRLGNMIQGGQIYYYGAFAKAVREFLWAPGRLEQYGPREYISETHKTEMRLTFTSGTFVKLDGADEFKGSKGINPDVLIADEAADYPDAFWNAMMPNLAAKDAIILVITSPPWQLETSPGEPVYFVRLMDLWKKHMKEGERTGTPNKYAYYNMPTSTNEHISKEWLDEERKTLIAMGLEHEWQREYEAKRVTGGGKRIIGTFDRKRHCFKHDFLLEKIKKDISILQWTTIVDPSQSAFGGLVMAINPYTKETYWLDEVFERDENETTEQLLWPRLRRIEDELFPSDDPNRFVRVCDEAAKWWIVGCANDPAIGVSFEQTEKVLNSIEMGLSLLRTVFFLDKGYVSERCQNFIWQLENWKRDKKGQMPDKDCDLIDCSRYGLHVNGYYITRDEKPMMAKLHPREQRRRLVNDMEHEIASLEENDLAKDLLGFAHNDEDDELSEDQWN